MVTAGFKGDIGRVSASRRTCLLQGFYFRMWAASQPVPATADDVF
jgi:hypothetical protein